MSTKKEGNCYKNILIYSREKLNIRKRKKYEIGGREKYLKVVFKSKGGRTLRQKEKKWKLWNTILRQKCPNRYLEIGI